MMNRENAMEEITKDVFYVQERAKERTECMNSVTQMPIKSVVPFTTWI